MKKTVPILLFLLAAGWLTAQTDPVICDGERFAYIALECRGPYAQVPDKLGVLMQELAKQKLPSDGVPLGIFHDALNPQAGAEPSWEVAFAVGGNPEVQPPLVKKEYSYPKQAEIVFKGSYTDTSNAYPKLLAFIEQNGYKPNGPAMESWMDDPAQTRPEDCRTLIVIPVEKKTP